MSDECAYSFWDLFRAAHKRPPTDEEKQEFLNSTHQERNRLVKRWARTAQWGVDDRMGSDGQIYIAFCPSWKRSDGHTLKKKNGTYHVLKH